MDIYIEIDNNQVYISAGDESSFFKVKKTEGLKLKGTIVIGTPRGELVDLDSEIEEEIIKADGTILHVEQNYEERRVEDNLRLLDKLFKEVQKDKHLPDIHAMDGIHSAIKDLMDDYGYLNGDEVAEEWYRLFYILAKEEEWTDEMIEDMEYSLQDCGVYVDWFPRNSTPQSRKQIVKADMKQYRLSVADLKDYGFFRTYNEAHKD